MRIALIIYHADPLRGGAERYTIDLAAALARAGHSVSILATGFSSLPENVHAVEIKANGAGRASRYRAFLDLVDLHLGATKYDVVHAMLPVQTCDLYHPHAGLAVAAFSTWRKKFQALFNPRRIAFARVERELLRNPKTRILCLSRAVQQDAQKWFDLPIDRLPILFNAVDLQRFSPSPKSFDADRVNALIIAQDFARKGLMTVLLAMKQLNDRRLHLTVIGKEPPGPYAYFAQHAGLIDRVHFAGATTDPGPFYQAADFFVLPTTHDPCSLVVLESLAMGVPVITTKINGASEIMTDSENGFVLDDPADHAALADRMKRMLDVETRRRMSNACLELRPRLSFEHHLSTLLVEYRAIAGLAT
jgi:UDP-glucose:(heptosyl)LPS alpha-1,3-glucosyltransferase